MKERAVIAAMHDSRSGIPCPFDQYQLARAFAPLKRDSGTLHICAVLSGNINTIVKIAWNDRQYGLRIRTQETVYRYEPEVVKEAFVIWLLNNHRKGFHDTAVATAFAELRALQYGFISHHPPLLPAVRYFDWSRQRLPHPYCIYDWIDGTPLWDTPEPPLYERAGRVLARVHEARLSAFYADFFAIGVQSVSWAERFSVALAKEVRAAGNRLPSMMIKRLRHLKLPTGSDIAPCLVHNDFAPGNILVRGGEVAAIIDWDNAVIDAPHLDFVKMKYWTAKNTQEELAHFPLLFAAFVEGYGLTGCEISSSPLFRLYEILWLLRVFNFERAKEEQGLPRAPGYPAAVTYEKHLLSMFA